MGNGRVAEVAMGRRIMAFNSKCWHIDIKATVLLNPHSPSGAELQWKSWERAKMRSSSCVSGISFCFQQGRFSTTPILPPAQQLGSAYSNSSESDYSNI